MNQDEAARAPERKDPPKGRLETADERQPPDFIIIGAQRAGTTSLYRYLTEHPRVGGAWRKEVHYFDYNLERGWRWYLAHFPKRGKFEAVGEASPYYLFDPDVPGRVHAALPDVLLIALLRNPIDRAFSQYQLATRRGFESESFADAVRIEPDRLAGGDAIALRRFSYLRRGHYAEQLERWLKHFPRERLLVLKSEELYADPARALDETQEFLGAERHLPQELRHYHASDYETAIDPATRAELRAYFEPHNRRLHELLGRDFGWELDR